MQLQTSTPHARFVKSSPMRSHGHMPADLLPRALALPMTRSHDQGLSTRAGEAARLAGRAREKERLSAQVAAAAEAPIVPRRRERAPDGGGMAVKLYLSAIAKVRRLTPQANTSPYTHKTGSLSSDSSRSPNRATRQAKKP